MVSVPPPLSVLVSELDSELARTALATFVALILDCTLRSEVVEGIFARASVMIENCGGASVEVMTGGAEQRAGLGVNWKETQILGTSGVIYLFVRTYTLARVFVISPLWSTSRTIPLVTKTVVTRALTVQNSPWQRLAAARGHFHAKPKQWQT